MTIVICAENVPLGETVKGKHVIFVAETPGVRTEKPSVTINLLFLPPQKTILWTRCKRQVEDVQSFGGVKAYKPILPFNEKKNKWITITQPRKNLL